jgi:arabinose-5-phosphate isomerase
MTTLLNDSKTLAEGRRVIALEAQALSAAEQRLDETFERAVDLIAESNGRVIISGIGKSGIIGRKIAATLTSTGTPAMFLHPVEGLHGDLGMVGREDVAILISKSGESDEMRGLFDYLSRVGVPMIGMTGRPASSLARACAVVLDCSVGEEACPHDLAPTTSTTVTLAIGDALAVALLQKKGFTREDFARLHPGGALGRKLTLTVADVMVDAPLLPDTATMRQAIVLLAEKRGTVAVVSGAGAGAGDGAGDLVRAPVLVGVITAGDLTRLLEKTSDFLDIGVSEVMNRSPKTIEPDALGSAAAFLMEKHGIMALPVVDGSKKLVGMVHLHDLMRAGAV